MLKKIYKKDGQDRLLPRLSLFIFDRSRTAALLWLCITVFGALSYTTFMQREGFPAINIPYSMVNGTYFANDPQKVDSQVAKPVSEIVLKDSRVKSVQTQSQGVSYSVVIQYKDGTNADQAGQDLQNQIVAAKVLPQQATLKVASPKFGFTERGDDGVVSVYTSDKTVSQQALVAEAQKVTTYLQAQNLPNLTGISVIDPFAKGVDPATGEPATTQTKYDRYGVRDSSQNTFYNSVAIGYQQKGGTDVIKLDKLMQQAVDRYNSEHSGSTFKAQITATYANDIKDQINELQRSLLEGLAAVLIVGSLVIAVRASIITVLSMLTVLASAVGVLYLAGYTLNTITLFALILCLGLVVDDTIIMVEAIDAQRRRHHDPRETVRIATRKVSRAMVAATLTASLSFAPLLFVGGILGSFIRAIPVTVITSLLVSLAVALVFIPFFARYLLLGKKQMGGEHVNEPAAKFEAKVAGFIGRPMLWARHSKKKLFSVGIIAVVVGMTFIGAGGYLFQKVTFNIFPPSKDSNGLTMQMTFPTDTTIQQAEQLSDKADALLSDTLGNNFRYASYYESAGAKTGTLEVYLLPYSQRAIRAPQLVDQLTTAFAGFDGAKVKVVQKDMAGPPASSFNVQIQTENRVAADKLARDVNTFLNGRELTRSSGIKAKITETWVSDPNTYSRTDNNLYINVGATFDGSDTTTLVTLAKDAVSGEFTADKLKSYGLTPDVLKYDIGQEQENQDSFKTLAMAFPILLFAIYLLLAIQFRSLAQPLLIFMALPFSLFGITLGLYLTDNSFSFFAMLGFFALIGLSIKNTILLTDYANQLRRDGATAVDAAVGALAERFRPLIATSLTAVVSLTPLALASPFWEGLAVVLIFGLLSSTLLVVTVFPYYYLGAEYLRLRVSRKGCLAWLAATAVPSGVLIAHGVTPLIIVIPAVVLPIITMVIKKLRRRSRKA